MLKLHNYKTFLMSIYALFMLWFAMKFLMKCHGENLHASQLHEVLSLKCSVFFGLFFAKHEVLRPHYSRRPFLPEDVGTTLP